VRLDDSPSVALSVWRTAQTIYSIYCTIAYVYVTLSAAFIISYLAAFCLIIDVVGRVFSYSSFTIFHQASSAGYAIAIESSQEGAAIEQPSSVATIKPLDPGHSEICSQEDVAIDHPSSTAALTPLDLGYSGQSLLAVHYFYVCLLLEESSSHLLETYCLVFFQPKMETPKKHLH